MGSTDRKRVGLLWASCACVINFAENKQINYTEFYWLAWLFTRRIDLDADGGVLIFIFSEIELIERYQQLQVNLEPLTEVTATTIVQPINPLIILVETTENLIAVKDKRVGIAFLTTRNGNRAPDKRRTSFQASRVSCLISSTPGRRTPYNPLDQIQ